MRRLLNTWVVAAVMAAVCLTGGASAGAVSGDANLPSAASLIERNATARGGLAAWRKVKTMTQFGHLEGATIGASTPNPAGASRKIGAPPHARSVAYTMYLARPQKMRLEVQVDGATAIRMFDGSHGWTIAPSPKGPIVAEFSPDEVRVAGAQQDLDGPLIDAPARGTKVDVEALESINGHDNYRLKLTTKDGTVRHLWIDGQTYLDTKVDGTRVAGGRTWPTETYFIAYKKVGHIIVPQVIETAIAGVRSTERVVIDRVVLNAPFEDSYFAPPMRTDAANARLFASPN